MAVIEAHRTDAAVEATHFDTKGELLYNLPEGRPGFEQSERKGLLSFLKRQREEVLPQHPEGPKHVLESIEEMGIADRVKRASDRLHEIATVDTVSGDRGSEYLIDVGSRIEIRVDEIETRRVERTGDDTPLVEVPQQVREIISSINRAAGREEKISTLSIGAGYVGIVTPNRISLVLRIPDKSKGESPGNALRFSVDTYYIGSTPEIEQMLREIEVHYSNKEELLDISDAVSKYVEQVVSKLPEEDALRASERKEEEESRIREQSAVKAAQEKEYEAELQAAEEKREREEKRKIEEIRLNPEQQRMLVALKEKYPNNSLLAGEFKELPRNYRSVFCSMSERRLVDCAKEGLTPSTKFFGSSSEGIRRMKYDTILDKAAPKGRSRTDSVYAFPELRTALDNGGEISSPGDVLVEIKVDPKNVLVANQELYNEAIERHLRNLDDVDGPAKRYWEEAMTLGQYLQLPENERQYKYHLPEVIIPGRIKPELMRVVMVVPNSEKTRS